MFYRLLETRGSNVDRMRSANRSRVFEEGRCRAFYESLHAFGNGRSARNHWVRRRSPKVHSVVRYWPCLINHQAIRHRVQCIGGSEPAVVDSKALWPPMSFASLEVQDPSGSKLRDSHSTFPANTLGSRCFGRSGDKGIGANVGILVRNPEDYPWLCEWLTEERVQNYFAAHGVQSVERFRFDALLGINFILRGVLRSSVRNDVQGKALAQALLLMPLNP